MNRLILAKNRRVEFPRRIKLTDPDTLNNSTYDLEFDPGLITEPGTNIDADLINLLQKNTVIDVKCETITSTEVNSNLLIELDGINEFSIFQGMKIILLLKENSDYNKPIQLNFTDNDEENGKYPVKVYSSGELTSLNNLPKGIYHMIFIDDTFIVTSSHGGDSSGSSKTVLWEGRQPLADGDFVNCRLSSIFSQNDPKSSNLIINITTPSNFSVDILIPVSMLESSGFNITIPSSNGQFSSFLVSNVKRVNNDLVFSSGTYTTYPGGFIITKVTLI